MRKLINRILVKLGLRKSPPMSTLTTGWKWYGGYGKVKSDDWIILGATTVGNPTGDLTVEIWSDLDE